MTDEIKKNELNEEQLKTASGGAVQNGEYPKPMYLEGTVFVLPQGETITIVEVVRNVEDKGGYNYRIITGSFDWSGCSGRYQGRLFTTKMIELLAATPGVVIQSPEQTP